MKKMRLIFARSAVLFMCVFVETKCFKTDEKSGEEILNYTIVKDSSHEDSNSRNIFNLTEDEGLQSDIFPPDIQTIFLAIETLPDGKCKNDSRNVLEAVVNREQWALQMFDSSPKFPIGVLYGSYYQLGNYDECIAVQSEIGADPIRGQYCLAEVDLHLMSENGGERYARSNGNFLNHLKATDRMSFNSTMYWAICIPSSCTTKDAVQFLRLMFKSTVTAKGLSIKLPKINCHRDIKLSFDAGDIVYGSAIGIFVALVVAATIYHLMHFYYKPTSTYQINSSNNLCQELALSFSLIKSIEKLVNVKTSELDLDFISGIKFISMLFIVASHTLVFVVGGPITNTEFYLKAVTKPQNAIFINNPLLVDSFLLIGGFLMCRLLLLELEKRRGKVNVLILYIARYIRLTPAYSVVIGLYCTILLKLDGGPLWNKVIMTERDRCLNSWWANLLYVNNYVNTDSICMFQSWYLSADTQLFIIAPLIIFPLWKWPRKGEILLGLTALITFLIPFVVTYIYELDPTLMAYPSELTDITTNKYYVFAYIKTHMKATPYVIGLVTGYIVHQMQLKNTKLNKNVVIMGWITATAMGLSSLLSIIVFYSEYYEYNPLESAMYAALHKLAWSLFIGWVVLACISNNSGPLKSFLSWPPFIPLSRLTYCAYLVNGFIELYAYGTLRSSNYMSIYSLASVTLSHLVLTFFFGFILCVLFESPIHSIEKTMLKRERSSTKPQTSLEEVNCKL